MKLWYKRKFKAATASLSNLVKNKIGLTPARLKELQQEQQEELDLELEHRKDTKECACDQDQDCQPLGRQPLHVVLVGFEDDEAQSVADLLGFAPASCVRLADEDWKEALQLFAVAKDAPAMDVLAVKLQSEDLRDIERGVLAMGFMKSIPSLALAPEASPGEAEVRNLAAGCLPVAHSLPEVATVVKEQVPRFLALREHVRRDIAAKAEQYKKVHYLSHFGKRAAIALIPFAVSIANFAGVLRLVKRIMVDTGMVMSKPVATTVGRHGAVATLQATVIEQFGDVYQYAVAATILADVGAALAGEGVSAAFATLDAVDFVLLGSVSFVTGTLSAIAAAYTRPQLVDAVASFLATLQVVYLLNPAMRRDVGSEDVELSSEVDELDSLLAPHHASDGGSGGGRLLEGVPVSDKKVD